MFITILDQGLRRYYKKNDCIEKKYPEGWYADLGVFLWSLRFYHMLLINEVMKVYLIKIASFLLIGKFLIFYFEKISLIDGTAYRIRLCSFRACYVIDSEWKRSLFSLFVSDFHSSFIVSKIKCFVFLWIRIRTKFKYFVKIS